MIVLVVSLLVIVAAAVLVVAYAAYPQRGGTIPRAAWLSDALQRAVDRTGMDPDADEAAHGGTLEELRAKRRTPSVRRRSR